MAPALVEGSQDRNEHYSRPNGIARSAWRAYIFSKTKVRPRCACLSIPRMSCPSRPPPGERFPGWSCLWLRTDAMHRTYSWRHPRRWRRARFSTGERWAAYGLCPGTWATRSCFPPFLCRSRLVGSRYCVTRDDRCRSPRASS